MWCQGGGCHLACVESVLKVGYYVGEKRVEAEERQMTLELGPEDASSGIKRVASSFVPSCSSRYTHQYTSYQLPCCSDDLCYAAMLRCVPISCAERTFPVSGTRPVSAQDSDSFPGISRQTHHLHQRGGLFSSSRTPQCMCISGKGVMLSLKANKHVGHCDWVMSHDS